MILKKLSITSKTSENTINPLCIVLSNLANVEKKEMREKDTDLERGKKGGWICR